jgi:general nucleoside transport system permease protein
MGIRIEKRRVISNTLLYLTPPLSVLATMIAGLFVFALLGFAPLTTMYHFFVSPLTTGYGLAELFLKALRPASGPMSGTLAQRVN